MLLRIARVLRGGRSAKRVFVAFLASQCLALCAWLVLRGWWRAYARDMPLFEMSRWEEAAMATLMAVPMTAFLVLLVIPLPVFGASLAAALSRRVLGRVPLALLPPMAIAWAAGVLLGLEGLSLFEDDRRPPSEVLTAPAVARVAAMAAVPLLAAWWWVRPPSPPAGTS